MLEFNSQQLSAAGCATEDELAAKLVALFEVAESARNIHTEIGAFTGEVSDVTSRVNRLSGSSQLLAPQLEAIRFSNQGFRALAETAATEVFGAAGAPTHMIFFELKT